MTEIGRRLAPAGMLAAFLLVASTAAATVMVEVPLEEMILRADGIVHGRVVDTDVRVSIEHGMEPQTYTTIRVEEWLSRSGMAGEDGATVQLREIGGSYRGITTEVAGVPRYHVGDEVIVFLERRPEDQRGDLRTLEMAQGKFVIQRGVGDAPSVVSRDLDGVAFVRWAEDGRQSIDDPPSEARMELEAFTAYIRHVLGTTTQIPTPGGVVR